MAKNRQSLAESSNQLSLFDLLSKEADERRDEPGTGSANVRDRLKEALSVALKTALPKSRWNIAGEMSHLLGHEITKFQIDSWVCESKEGHRIPAEYIPAFVKATGCLVPLQVLSDSCKVFVLAGPEALRAELRRDEEEIKSRQQAKRKKEALLAALEGK